MTERLRSGISRAALCRARTSTVNSATGAPVDASLTHPRSRPPSASSRRTSVEPTLRLRHDEHADERRRRAGRDDAASDGAAPTESLAGGDERDGERPAEEREGVHLRATGDEDVAACLDHGTLGRGEQELAGCVRREPV